MAVANASYVGSLCDHLDGGRDFRGQARKGKGLTVVRQAERDPEPSPSLTVEVPSSRDEA